MTRNSIIFTMLLLSLPVLVFAQNVEKEKAAIAVGDKWLVIVDEGKYAESWDASAEFIKTEMTKEQWVESFNIARKPLGKMISRKLKSSTYTTTPHSIGAPAGEYVMIEYETSFENQKSAIERMTLKLEKDGIWMNAGYYIVK